MPAKNPLQLSIIGSGNVAWHMANMIQSSGHQLLEIIARNAEQGASMAEEFNVPHKQSPLTCSLNADIIIVAVSDKAVSEIIENLTGKECLVVHTAGSLPLDVFNTKLEHFGVLYPFQTLSRGISVNYKKLPLCIEASDTDSLQKLSILANSMSGFVREMNSEQRKNLHLAGIILNNFSNHLVALATDYLQGVSIDRKLIEPLLEETFKKVLIANPAEAQTGPARRGDLETIREHLRMLEDTPELKNLYSLISDSIIAYYNKRV